MKVLQSTSLIMLFIAGILTACNNNRKPTPEILDDSFLDQVAETPPMGWNSFDAYDCRINEEEFLATVDYMADNLLEYGWNYAVIDYIWWHPNPGLLNDMPRRRYGHPNILYDKDGQALEPITMDEYGRLLPSVERFPSSAEGKGFKPIADYVHGKGMKFGIHIMRGIHRSAFYENTPIMESDFTAKYIAEQWDTCGWCNHMYGVDAQKEGAQEYYNSLLKLYASWGVDFIKADDMMFPPYHGGEIEMIRKAIDQCGRPMVLSLSCGEAPLSQAKHLEQNANMWRISGDFWDNWESLRHNFELLNQWSSYIGPHHWPDADMIPIGKLSLNNRPHGPERMSEFTPAEELTLMSLWAMAKSPLMLGGDLLTTPDSVMALFKNKEVLNINQQSIDNRQVYNRNDEIAWIATDSNSEDRYIALFNVGEEKKEISFNLELEHLRGSYAVWDIWSKENIGTIEKELKVTVSPHGVRLFKLKKS
jgi:alpha-galactosidase